MNLAPRSGLNINGATPANVAPNTYDPSPACCKYAKKHFAPFLSSAIRLKPLKQVDGGFYDPPKIRSKIKYGNSLQFTEERKTIVINTFGDPNEEVIAKPRLPKPKLAQSKRLGGRGKLYVCHMPYTIEAAAPSIPTHMDENGYWINEDNKIVKNPPDKHDTSLGPAFYEVPTGEVFYNTIRYKGCEWSKMKGQRTKVGISDNPGPADYNPKLPKCVQYQDTNQFRPLTRTCCNVPRYTCDMMCQAKKLDQPGPGYYEIVDIDKVGKPKNLSLDPRKPFITREERFIYKMEKGVGPQTYEVCDCFKLRRDFNLSDTPFSNGAERFRRNQGFSAPAPGTYDPALPKCERYSPNNKAPFFTTEIRKLMPVDNAENPGPAEYDLKFAKCCPQEEVPRSSMFSSMVCRFGKYKPQVDLSSATYDITPAFNALKKKKSHAIGKPTAFNCSEPRLAKINDFAGFVYGLDTPGVGEYDIKQACFCESNGQYFNMSPRFGHKTKEKRPGPGYYDFHPSTEAMYKANSTHNSRLMKDIKQKRPEIKVKRIRRPAYGITIKDSRERVLRFFARKGEFRHC